MAVQDYYSRIKDHEAHYEPVEETTWPFIRIMNVRLRREIVQQTDDIDLCSQVGEKIMVNDVRGYLQVSTHP